MSLNQPPLSLVQRTLLILLCVGMAASLYFGGSAAVADALSLQSRWLINQWQASKQSPPTPSEWGRARNELVAAQKWVPDDPQVNEYLGYLYGLRASKALGIPELKQAMLNESISYYRLATVKRPMSPYAWANLSYALHSMGGQNDAMWEAFDRAYQYGNREGGVQRTLAEVGFSHWNEAGTQRQTQLTAMIDSALDYSRGNLIAIATKYGKKDLLDK